MDSVKGLALAAMMLLASATMLVFAMGDFSVDEELDSSQTMAEDPLIQGEDHDHREQIARYRLGHVGNLEHREVRQVVHHSPRVVSGRIRVGVGGAGAGRGDERDELRHRAVLWGGGGCWKSADG